MKLWDLHAGSEGCMRRADESIKVNIHRAQVDMQHCV